MAGHEDVEAPKSFQRVDMTTDCVAVDDLEAENQILKARFAEELVLGSFEGASDAKRKGLVALMELGTSNVDFPMEKMCNFAKARLQRRYWKVQDGCEETKAPDNVADFFIQVDHDVEEKLNAELARMTSLDTEVEILRAELAAARERHATHEASMREEQIRYDVLIADQMQEIKMELYKLDQEAAVLRSSLEKSKQHAAGRKVLQRIFRFMAPQGLAREILWRWRFLLPP